MAPSVDGLLSLNSPEQGSSLDQHFWNANLPRSQWTEKCPDFLLGQGSKNIGILSSHQDDYRNLSWEESKSLVDTNRIDEFQRPPLELRRYLQYMYHLKRQHGSVLNFVQRERLRWDLVSPSGRPPFEDSGDFKILYNDWPYGIDSNITHLVVWVKFLFEDDPETGYLEEKHYKSIDEFVQQTFCGDGGLRRDQVVWFRNWRSLKSVHALEHFHVMLYQAPSRFLEEITGNDKPMCEVVNGL